MGDLEAGRGAAAEEESARFAWRLALALFRRGRKRPWVELGQASAIWLGLYAALGAAPGLALEVLVFLFFLYCWFLFPLTFAFLGVRSLRESANSGFLHELALAGVSKRDVFGAHAAAALAGLLWRLGPGMAMAPAVCALHMVALQGPQSLAAVAALVVGTGAISAGHLVGSCALAAAAWRWSASRGRGVIGQILEPWWAVGVGHLAVGIVNLAALAGAIWIGSYGGIVALGAWAIMDLVFAMAMLALLWIACRSEPEALWPEEE